MRNERSCRRSGAAPCWAAVVALRRRAVATSNALQVLAGHENSLLNCCTLRVLARAKLWKALRNRKRENAAHKYLQQAKRAQNTKSARTATRSENLRHKYLQCAKANALQVLAGTIWRHESKVKTAKLCGASTPDVACWQGQQIVQLCGEPKTRFNFCFDQAARRSPTLGSPAANSGNQATETDELNTAVGGLVQRFVKPNATLLRCEDTAKLARAEEHVSCLQVLAASIAQTATRTEATV